MFLVSVSLLYRKCFVNICPAADDHFYLLIYLCIYILVWKRSRNFWGFNLRKEQSRVKRSQSRFALERNNAIISLFSTVILGIIGRMAKINWGLCCNSPSLSQRAMLSLTYIVYQMLFKDLFAPAAILFQFLLQLSSLNNLMSMKNDANLTNPVFRIFLPELPGREAPRRWPCSLLG